MTLSLKFWGVRGSIAVPSPKHIRYGGNTSCIEVVAGGNLLILDAGTGIRSLGPEIQQRDIRDIRLLFNHTHWDHINGFPFFVPAYDQERTIHVIAGHLKDRGGIEGVLSDQMEHPMFPVPLEEMRAKMSFEDINAGDSFEPFPGVTVRTASLYHPNGATGYRIEQGGRSLCYVTDTEHIPGRPDQNVLGLIEGADLVVYDSTYTEEEFPQKIGWGHSTWNEGVRLCQAANVKRLVIFHHEPDHDDDFMDKLAAEAKETWSETVVAREGMEIVLD